MTLYFGMEEKDTGSYCRVWEVRGIKNINGVDYTEVCIDGQQNCDYFTMFHDRLIHYSEGTQSPFTKAAGEEEEYMTVADFTLGEGETFAYSRVAFNQYAKILKKTADEIVIEFDPRRTMENFIITFRRGAGISQIIYPQHSTGLYLVKREEGE